MDNLETISSEHSNSPNKLEKDVVDKLRSDLEKTLTSEIDSADVKFHIKAENEDDKSIVAHSFILKARSKVFAAIIQDHGPRNGMINLHINDYSFEGMSALINFMYTAKTSNISDIADELLMAADYV